MKRLCISAAFLLVVACGGSVPSPTPTAVLSAAPIAAEKTVAPFIMSALEDWTPGCQDVPTTDCYGVAALFVNNLARNGQWVLEQSGGLVAVTPRPVCPAFGDLFGGTQDPSYCWQASAVVDDGTVCMVIARQTAPIMGFGFGQVGGDEMAGLAVPPGYEPKDPCI